MKISQKTRISLLFYKYISGPLTDGFVNLCQCFFVWLDRVTGNEVQPISAEEELREYRKQNVLNRENVPEGLRDLVPLAEMWGIGDDAIRGEIVDAATDEDKRNLATAMDGKLAVVDEWLDEFPEGSLTDEAAAFMYLAEAIEELGLKIS